MQWTEGYVNCFRYAKTIPFNQFLFTDFVSLNIVKKDVQEKPYPEEDAPIHSEHDRTIYNSIAYDRCK